MRKDDVTGALRIVSVIPTSPAEAAGILSDDSIVEVDGENITGLTQEEIISRVRGPAGTKVRLGIERLGVSGLMQIDVVRARVSIPSVETEMIDGVAYVRLNQFAANTTQELHEALVELTAQKPTGMILDLRGNPGGFLQTVVEVAGEFLPEGEVLTARSAGDEDVYQATAGGLAEELPLVVLVDQGSASASELLAGAIQDRARGVLVGTTTFGKGTVQTWRPLSNGGGVRITISRWYTPNDRSIEEVGLTPDVIVQWPASAITEDFDPQLQAALRVLRGEAVWPTWPLPLVADTFVPMR
ncbi:MAG: S41 family peptidase [Anaerolineae bacterium]|nr:S41 family peptidase [Anaerolineae bacterium]